VRGLGKTRHVRSRLALAGLLVLLIACGSEATEPERATRPTPEPESVRSTTEGPVIGFRGSEGTHAWLGIPFAEPPTGKLRWRAPLPPSDRMSRLEATQAGSACPQIASSFGGVPGPEGTVVGSEDCLYLNVWAPGVSPNDLPQGDRKLPVMVWVHGGANAIGTGSSFDGALLSGTQNVIVITLNYRLGPLGWFRHPALRGHDTSPSDDSGNYGILDLIRALAWIRENAAAFGGDPDRISVFGESAGGVNVFCLLASPLAQGLFQRAIVQSAIPASEPVERGENLSDAAVPGNALSGREVALRLLIARERATTRSQALALADSMPAGELAAFLRSVSPAELIAVYDPGASGGFLQFPLNFRDGHVLPRDPLGEHLTQPSGVPTIPVMLGTNRDEIRAFQLGAGIGIKNLLGLFPRAEDPERYVRSAYYGSAIWKATGADEVAASWARSGAESVWVYRFDWDEEPESFVGNMQLLLGAAHAIEVPFLFGSFEYGSITNMVFTDENEPGRRTLSRAMMSYWAQFADTGNPGRGRANDLPPWKAWSEARQDAPRFMILDTPQDGGLRMENVATTRSRVAAELAEDGIFSTRDERCELMRFAELTNGVEWNRQHYARVGCSPETPPASEGE